MRAVSCRPDSRDRRLRHPSESVRRVATMHACSSLTKTSAATTSGAQRYRIRSSSGSPSYSGGQPRVGMKSSSTRMPPGASRSMTPCGSLRFRPRPEQEVEGRVIAQKRPVAGEHLDARICRVNPPRDVRATRVRFDGHEAPGVTEPRCEPCRADPTAGAALCGRAVRAGTSQHSKKTPGLLGAGVCEVGRCRLVKGRPDPIGHVAWRDRSRHWSETVGHTTRCRSTSATRTARARVTGRFPGRSADGHTAQKVSSLPPRQRACTARGTTRPRDPRPRVAEANTRPERQPRLSTAIRPTRSRPGEAEIGRRRTSCARRGRETLPGDAYPREACAR